MNTRDSPADVVLAVPEIRDYHAINSEIVRHLDAGRRTIRLAGVRGNGCWRRAWPADGPP